MVLRSIIKPNIAISIGAITALSGCRSPLDSSYELPDLGNLQSLLGEDLEEGPGLELQPTKNTTTIEKALEERMGEIEAMTPVPKTSSWPQFSHTSLEEDPLEVTAITINKVVNSVVSHNLDLEIARLQPQISNELLISNEAAFDFVLGAGSSTKKSKIPQQQASEGGIPFGTSESVSDAQNYEVSLVKKLSQGGTITMSTDLTKTDSDSSGFTYEPNPGWQSVGTIDFKQPLLRGFGEKVALSEIALSKNATLKTKEEFRQSLHTIITEAELAYWDLALQWRVLQVQEWLLREGELVVEILELRRSYDTNEADYAQAVATVEQRNTDVISQQSVVQNKSDELKELMNDPSYPLESDMVLSPSGVIETKDVFLSLRDTVLTAIKNRPDLMVLKIAIDDQNINIQVADSARFPQLDLQAQLSFYGLDSGASGAYKEVFDSEYMNYLVGLTFEYPLGNRAAEAGYASSRLKRITEIASYKKGLQQIVREIKTAMRSVATNSELISANRSFRVAQAENLRALQVEEETLGGLTPTFLNLKLQTQAGLANARIAEFTSAVNFNKALASLYKAAGTTLEMHQISFVDALSADN
ncbi:MAG: TolC family protein [Phycisphaerales bacterium]|nr:TolC family protein [Phycisphaerales bacterium]MDP6693377.1 TolC family protein [Phycisphaerales bacterium]